MSDKRDIRASGRSTLMARILVETALESKEELVITDHFLCYGRYHISSFYGLISQEVKKIEHFCGIKLDLNINSYKNTITVGLCHPWTPLSGYAYEKYRIGLFEYPSQSQQNRTNKKLLMLRRK